MRKLIASIAVHRHTNARLRTDLSALLDESQVQDAYILFLERQLPAGHIEDPTKWVPVILTSSALQ